jgi:hypothetical protein
VIDFPFTRSEPSELVSHKALRLVDVLTGQGPIPPVRTFLDRREPNNTWVPIDAEAVTTASGVLIYAALERSADVINVPPTRYRVRIEADRYLPQYRLQFDGIEFDAYPYNDDVVVNPFAQTVELVPLIAAPPYPFPAGIPVLRGTVVRASDGTHVAFARVTKLDANLAVEEEGISDERGEFALPLRRVVVQSQPIQFDIDVIDLRTNERQTKSIVLPDMLGINVVIDIL